MTKVGIGCVVGTFMLTGIIASIATGNYFITILLIPPTIALLILFIMYKLGLIPERGRET